MIHRIYAPASPFNSLKSKRILTKREAEEHEIINDNNNDDNNNDNRILRMHEKKENSVFP